MRDYMHNVVEIIFHDHTENYGRLAQGRVYGRVIKQTPAFLEIEAWGWLDNDPTNTTRYCIITSAIEQIRVYHPEPEGFDEDIPATD